MEKDVPVVILAGGLGLRMRDYSHRVPKALVPIGGMAIIIHVIKIYMHHGCSRFIVCTGYKTKQIEEHLKKWSKDDTRLNITVVNTGADTPTGGRIKMIERHIDTDNFFVTYCDGVSDIDIAKLYAFHIRLGKIATLTAVHPVSPFGTVEAKDGVVYAFKEKPALPGLINGGFFVFNKKIFKHLSTNSILEEETIRRLTDQHQLAAYSHKGFWSCMDTFKDVVRLQELWDKGYMPHVGIKLDKAPWKVWTD